MNYIQKQLKELALADLPFSFLHSIVKKITFVYKEADALAYNTPSWNKEQGQNLQGHLRNAMVETLFEKSVKKSGGIAVPMKNHVKNYNYVLARFNRLVLTTKYVERQKGPPPRPSKFRQRLAECNNFLRQPTLTSNVKGFDVFDSPNLYKKGEIYGIILHGSKLIKGKSATLKKLDTNGFLNLIFTNEKYDKVVANFDLFRLYTIAIANCKNGFNQTEDKAIPRLKKTDPYETGEA